jgi:hypothetical protein
MPNLMYMKVCHSSNESRKRSGRIEGRRRELTAGLINPMNSLVGLVPLEEGWIRYWITLDGPRAPL